MKRFAVVGGVDVFSGFTEEIKGGILRRCGIPRALVHIAVFGNKDDDADTMRNVRGQRVVEGEPMLRVHIACDFD